MNTMKQKIKKAGNVFLRIQGAPRAVACGFSAGVFVGMTPLIGLHTALALIIAIWFKWNKIAACIGVQITNVFTAPLFYTLTYWVGAKITGHTLTIDFSTMGLSWEALYGFGRQAAPSLFISLFVGGVVVGLPLAFLTYFISFHVYSQFRKNARPTLKKIKSLTKVTSKEIKGQIKLAGPVAVFCSTILCAASLHADHSNSTIRHYMENDGQTTRQITWDLKHGDGFTLTYITDEETHITCTTESLSTISWTMNAGARGNVKAERQDDTITIRGELDGRNIDKRIHVDNAPWYQATSLSLKEFILSDKRETFFWTLRPDTLKAYKLKAVKKGCELLAVGRKPVDIEAVKVKLSLTGMLAPFWSSYYWFSMESGMFLRFQGQADASGKTQVSVTYTEDAPALLPR